MRLEITTSWVYVYDASAEAVTMLYENLATPNTQAFFINKKRQAINDRLPPDKQLPYEDTKYRLYDLVRHRFPRGSIFTAVGLLSEHGFVYDFSYSKPRHEPAVEADVLHSRDPWQYPYDFQGECIDKFFAAEFGIVEVPTRGGKTTIGLVAAGRMLHHGPVLYLVTTKEAQRQVVSEAKDYLFGGEGSGLRVSTDVADDGICVLTYATATKRNLSSFVFVIADEAHRVPADTFFDVLAACTSAWYRLGLTGTVEGRSDGKDDFTTAAVGPVVASVERSTLIDRGLCSDGNIIMLEYKGSPYLMDDAVTGDWRSIERLGISENRERNELLVDTWANLWHDMGQTLFMVEKHAQGKQIQALLKERGIDAPFVHGKTKKAKRDALYEQMAAGEIPVAVASKIYNDSLTFPHLTVAVNCAGGKSEASSRQKLGRVLTGGDKRMVFVDVMDRHHRTLQRHAYARRRAYEKDGYTVEVR